MNITKICPHCKIEKCETEYHKRRNNKNLASYCKSCTILQTTQRQQKLKQDSINYKGGKCLSCNYNSYQGALEFHHLDPNEKEFNISQARYLNFNSIKKELDKCMLLCSNCHKEIHGKLIKYDEKSGTIIRNSEVEAKIWSPTNSVVNSIKNKIDVQSILIRLKNKEKTSDIAKDLNITSSYLTLLLNENNIYIHQIEEQQDVLYPTKIEWPSIEEMTKLVWEKSTVVLAKELGVSDVAIAKFCKKHNIPKPERGYWAKQKAQS